MEKHVVLFDITVTKYNKLLYIKLLLSPNMS